MVRGLTLFAVFTVLFSVSSTEWTRSPDCLLPMETGMCEALFYRFGYSATSDECVKFVYGGCGANANNFRTKEDCETNCKEPST